MRLLINALYACCLLILIAALYLSAQDTAREVKLSEATRDAVHSIDQIIKYRATVMVGVADATLNERGYPTTVDVAWFKDGVPRNPLVGPPHPWLEIAGESEAALQHPPVRLAVSDSLAQFWYNPYQGVVRARVPVMISDAKSTALYNKVNATNLAGILDFEPARDEVFRFLTPTDAKTQTVQAPE